ncbi:MAG: hypothetical protein AB1374_10325 [Bacillota bacterium]
MENEIYSSDIVFIDSGGYEVKSNPSRVDSLHCKPWGIGYYLEVLNKLRPLAQLILVNYDCGESQPLIHQMEKAQILFSRYPSYASDFLCKPEREDSQVINVDEVVDNVRLFASFSIFGVTEKELGDSLLSRCRNLLTIRSAFLGHGLEIPIHIFGCLDPVSVVAYFLCGADIFDGLTWLRYKFIDGLTFSLSTARFLLGQWEYCDNELDVMNWIQNLQFLDHLLKSMIKFINTRSVNEFFMPQEYMARIVELVKTAGLQIGGEK